jgi:iron complex outermembrane receptor protein
VLTVLGDPDLETEEATAYELGYRHQIFEATRLDIALFYNNYENTRTIVDRAPVCQPGSIPIAVNPVCFLTADYVNLPVQITNGGDIDSNGAELSISHRILPTWWVQGSYTYLHVDDAPDSTASAVSQDYPEHQFSLRSALNPTTTTQFDFWLRYVDKLPAQDIDSYTTVDARASWSPLPPLELALVGRNLLQERHGEFLQEFNESIPVEIEREAYLELRWRF